MNVMMKSACIKELRKIKQHLILAEQKHKLIRLRKVTL